MLNPYVVALAAEEHVNENVPNHWLVGGIALGILLVMLLALLVFGAGREHS
jgi:hypothetical protein